MEIDSINSTVQNTVPPEPPPEEIQASSPPPETVPIEEPHTVDYFA